MLKTAANQKVVYYESAIVWVKWIIFAGIVAKFVLNSTES